MTYEEYEKAVYEYCQRDGYVKTHPEAFERVFDEEKSDIKRRYEKGRSIEDTAWGICLLVD